MYAIFIFFWLTSLAAYADYDVRASVKVEYDLIHCMHVLNREKRGSNRFKKS